jgi:hypothetical protein
MIKKTSKRKVTAGPIVNFFFVLAVPLQSGRAGRTSLHGVQGVTDGTGDRSLPAGIPSAFKE